MKLTLEQLAGYLPYGLEFYLPDNFLKRVEILEISNLQQVLRNQYKPVLYPLSAITEEIEVNGERFVPFDEVQKIRNRKWVCFEEEMEYCELFHYSDHTENTYYKISDFPYQIIKKLYEWHFDIHRLIENGLAIDKSNF